MLSWDQAETEADDRAGGGRKGRSVGRHSGDGQRYREGENSSDEGAAFTVGVSLSVGKRVAQDLAVVEYAPHRCHSARDCDDGDPCSLDACVEVPGLLCLDRGGGRRRGGLVGWCSWFWFPCVR